jgi:hypothetical protein
MTRDVLTRLTAVALSLAATMPLGTAFAADRPLGVVELFTSQGCNSCPPADAVFTDMVKRKDIIALAYHVTYWDYLGWRDTLANGDNTQRQYAYGKAFGIRSVYTPQAVINGRVHVNGAKREAVDGSIRTLAKVGEGLSVDIKATVSGDVVVIEVGSGAPVAAHLLLVGYDAANPVAIRHGENSGNVITYWNAVTDMQTAGMWHGKPVRFELPAAMVNSQGGAVALLQAVKAGGLPGAILGAAVIRRPEASGSK